MVKVHGIHLLKYQIDQLKQYGIKKIYILSGHLSDEIKKYTGDGTQFGVKIIHITEHSPLGTAGSLKQLDETIKERFLVIYGDVIFNIDIKKLIQFDEKVGGMATLVAHPNNHPQDSDLIEINEECEITKIHTKPHDEKYYRNLVNSGIFIFSPSIFTEIPDIEPADIGRDVLSKISNIARLHAYVTPEYIMDIGTPERLIKARKDLASGKINRLNLKNKRKAIFLDRDGVINKFIMNLSDSKQFDLIPEVEKAIKEINQSEYLAIVITNQPAIAKGMMTPSELRRMHDKMDHLLGMEGAYIDALYYCPHHPDKGFPGEVSSLKINCKCRKPNPGMLIRAATDLNIDLKNSWLIGDSHRDMRAGKIAGCKTIGIGIGHIGNPDVKVIAKNLYEAIGVILP